MLLNEKLVKIVSNVMGNKDELSIVAVNLCISYSDKKAILTNGLRAIEGEYSIVVNATGYSSNDRAFKPRSYSWTSNTLAIRLPTNR